MISAALFDLDETLLNRTLSLTEFLVDQYTRFSSKIGNVSFEAWRDRFLALDARGHVHKSVVYPAILSEFSGDKAAANALLADYREGCYRYAQGFPGMTETLKALRTRGLRLGIVTNGETEFQTRHINALNLGSLVDAVFISEAEGLRKPDAALFRRAAKRLDVEPGRSLFVGDNPMIDILGAHAAGMLTAWFGQGAVWPIDIPPMPGVVINALPEILKLPGIAL